MGAYHPLDNYSISCLLRGIRRFLGDTPHEKEPITPAILIRILSQLDLSQPEDSVLWASCLVMFFALLGRATVLSPSEGHIPSKHLYRNDFTFHPLGMMIHIIWIKTIQSNEKCFDIPIARFTGNPLHPEGGTKSLLPSTSS